MGKAFISSEVLITPLAPERALKLADECLVDIRVVESRNQSHAGARYSAWMYEYEVKGEAGKVEKFLKRIKTIEIND